MSSFLVFPYSGFDKTVCFDWSEKETVSDLKKRINSFFSLEEGSCYLTNQGIIAQDTQLVRKDEVYRVCQRIPGGKGGFGSMLRAIGAQIEKTTNREACRDLSGRRMRDVNNEKKLKDWIGKKADREREKERIRKERLARRLAVPQHNFDDPNYEDQKSKVADNLVDALQSGLQKNISKGDESSSTNGSSETLGKRSAEASSCLEAGPSKSKISRKSFEWMGVDGGCDLDSDFSDSDSEHDKEPVHLEGDISTSDSEKMPHTSDVVSQEQGTSSKSAAENIDESAGVRSRDNSLLNLLPSPIFSSETAQQPVDEYQKDPGAVDLEKFKSVEELEKLGLDTLKTVLMFRGLKCGGTLQERAERLFSVKGLQPEEINPSLLAKSQGRKGGKKKQS